MRAPLLKEPWKRGPAAGAAGPLVISFTEFSFRWRDVPAIVRAGRRMSRALLGLEGAVGLSLYMRPLRGCSGSVSVWRSEADLRGFVALPEHIAIMRRYRGRGSLRSATWTADSFALGDTFAEAERRMAAT